MKRFLTITKVKPEKYDEYIEIHNNIFPEVVAASHECNTRNFTIFNFGYYLVNYSEYIGVDYEKDMLKKSQMPAIIKWKKLTSACLEPVSPDHAALFLNEVFHCDF